MNVHVPRRFIEDLFRSLYHHILPQFDLMGRNCAVLLEPVYLLTVHQNTIVGWQLVEHYIQPDFDILGQRNRIIDGLRAASGSNLEQILVPVDKDVFVLWDNPLEFPGERLAHFVRQILPRADPIVPTLSGICHFHPTESAAHGDDDVRTMQQLARELVRYGVDRLVSLIVAKGNAAEYVKQAGTSDHQFAMHMMTHLDNTHFHASEFCVGRETQPLGITLS